MGSDSRVAYYCDAYNCIADELPCPHCGADDHEGHVVDGGAA